MNKFLTLLRRVQGDRRVVGARGRLRRLAIGIVLVTAVVTSTTPGSVHAESGEVSLTLTVSVDPQQAAPGFLADPYIIWVYCRSGSSPFHLNHFEYVTVWFEGAATVDGIASGSTCNVELLDRPEPQPGWMWSGPAEVSPDQLVVWGGGQGTAHVAIANHAIPIPTVFHWCDSAACRWNR